MRKLFFLSDLIITFFTATFISLAFAEEPPPNLHIRYQVDKEFERNMIKLNWEQCVNEKNSYLIARKKTPSVWPQMEKAIKKKQPDYNFDAQLAPEPKWSLIAVDTEEEYFSAEKYAKYTTSNKYSVSKDGRCEVISQQKHTAELDDGQFEYILDLSKATGIKRTSPAIIRKQTDRATKQSFSDQPILGAASDKIVRQNDLTKTMIDGGIETITDGQTCQNQKPAGARKTRLCYWTKMSHYPSIMERPIILKSVINLGKATNTRIATSFASNRTIPERVFRPDNAVKIKAPR